MTTTEIALGLGTNLGARRENLAAACRALTAAVFSGTAGSSPAVRYSSLYETAALLLPNAPSDWNIPYLNMVVRGNTCLSLGELLEQTQAIEYALGRRESPRWSPRIIDIDILIFGGLTYTDHSLTIPHPQIGNRAFVLEPLAEVWPDLSLHGTPICSCRIPADPSMLAVYPR